MTRTGCWTGSMHALRCRLVPILLGALALLGGAAPTHAAPYELAVGTGGVTGIYYQFGAAICRLLRDHPPGRPIDCVTQGSGGSVANLQNLREGRVPLALAQSDATFDAATGAGGFTRQGADPKLRALFSPLTEAFMVLVRIRDWAPSLADLRGLRLNIGAPASGSEGTFRELLAARGWSASDFTHLTGLRTSLQATALCGGQVDAISFVAANPVPVMQEATFACRARFVPLDQEFARTLIDTYPYYVAAEIPGGLYPNNPDPVPTIGVRAILVASADTPDDVVYWITRTVFEQLAQLRTLHLAFAHITAQDMLDQCVFAPVHAGAMRYFREAGLKPPRRCLPK